MENFIKCKKCNSTDFIIVETLVWKASSDEEGILNAFNKGNEIESITCRNCEEPVKNIEEININFQ